MSGETWVDAYDEIVGEVGREGAAGAGATARLFVQRATASSRAARL